MRDADNGNAVPMGEISQWSEQSTDLRVLVGIDSTAVR
jgi:hypothetical protein